MRPVRVAMDHVERKLVAQVGRGSFVQLPEVSGHARQGRKVNRNSPVSTANAVRDLAFRQGAIVQARDQFCRVRADIFQKGHCMRGPGQSLRRGGIGPDDLACRTVNKRRRWGGGRKAR